MKKIISAGLIATALLGGIATPHSQADASELNYNKLSQMAQTNDKSLSTKALQKGQYDFKFVKDNYEYHFYSNGRNFGYDYHYTNKKDTSVNTQSKTKHITSNANIKKVSNTSYNATNTKVNKQPVSVKTNNSYTPTKRVAGGSVKARFLNSGGTERMWNSIVLPESSGNPNAVSPNGYHGLGQTKEHWGYGSVENQTKGMINYAVSRYGSVDNAVNFRLNNGWW